MTFQLFQFSTGPTAQSPPYSGARKRNYDIPDCGTGIGICSTPTTCVPPHHTPCSQAGSAHHLLILYHRLSLPGFRGCSSIVLSDYPPSHHLPSIQVIKRGVTKKESVMHGRQGAKFISEGIRKMKIGAKVPN